MTDTAAERPLLRIHSLRVRAVSVPLRLPLATRSGSVATAPLVLLDLHTDQGVTGRAYLFCVTPLALKPMVRLLDNLAPTLQGQALAPLALYQQLQRQFRLLGTEGLTGMAIAAIDMAAWDALAQAQGLPLVRLLGAQPRPLPAYNSNGLGLMGLAALADQAPRLLARGFTAIKLRLGHADAAADLAAVHAVRQVVGEGVHLMTDYNQGLSVAEAGQRLAALAGAGLAWVEEPTLSADTAGHARLRQKATMPVQLGENWWGPLAMAQALAAGACDLAMPDVMRIGGVSGWLQAATLASTAGMPLSSHLFPEISAHLLAASATAHWLEYVDWAEPVLRTPLRIEGGMAHPSQTPGTGVDWDEAAVARYAAD